MSQQSLLDPEDRIVDVDIADQMGVSPLADAMSVIVGRAMPEVGDGLKPVRRRILPPHVEGAPRSADRRPGRGGHRQEHQSVLAEDLVGEVGRWGRGR